MTLREGALIVLVTLLAIVLATTTHISRVVGIVFWLVLLIASLALERSRYRPRVDRAARDWTPTGERFRDPESGELVEVVTRPNGERDYRRVDDPTP